MIEKQDIKRYLPHRDPFLFVDGVTEIIKDEYIKGYKEVKEEEYYFKGHFPDNPIMPGVLQIEAMAQAGGVLVLSRVPDPENYSTYFMKIESAKFKEKVVPGDTLIMRLDLLAPVRRGICLMKGQAYVGTKLVVEAELMAQIVKDKNNN